MGKNYKPIVRPAKWTFHNLKKVVKKYDYRSEFKAKDGSAYESARIHNLLDLLFEDKPNQGFMCKRQCKANLTCKKRKSKKYWTKERIIEEGLKYDSRLEFKKSHITAYKYALCQGYLDEIFKDKPNLGYQKARIAKGKISDSTTGHRKYWTEDRVIKKVSTWKGSLTKLCKKYPGLTATIDRLGLRPKISEIRNSIYDSMPREQILADAKKYTSRHEFRKRSFVSYCAARNQNILDELFPL